MHIKASKIWQQRIHNYSAYDSIDIPVCEAEVSKFAGDDAEFIQLLKVLIKNSSFPHSKAMVGNHFAIEYANGVKTVLDFDALLSQLHRCKDTADALNILKVIIPIFKNK